MPISAAYSRWVKLPGSCHPWDGVPLSEGISTSLWVSQGEIAALRPSLSMSPSGQLLRPVITDEPPRRPTPGPGAEGRYAEAHDVSCRGGGVISVRGPDRQRTAEPAGLLGSQGSQTGSHRCEPTARIGGIAGHRFEPRDSNTDTAGSSRCTRSHRFYPRESNTGTAGRSRFTPSHR